MKTLDTFSSSSLSEFYVCGRRSLSKFYVRLFRCFKIILYFGLLPLEKGLWHSKNVPFLCGTQFLASLTYSLQGK